MVAAASGHDASPLAGVFGITRERPGSPWGAPFVLVQPTSSAIGDFINALVSFLLIGAAVYFLIVLPVNNLLARMRGGEAAPDPTTKKRPECLSDVPIAAR